MKKLILSLLLIFCWIPLLFGAVDIFNQSVEINESYSEVVITFQFTFVDSSDKYHTRPIFIGDCNLNDGYVSAVQSAAGDANVIYHFTGVDNILEDVAIWSTTTPAGFDATSNTAKFDTIGIENNVNDIKFHNARWLVIEVLGGGTSNADDNVFTMIMNLRKDGDYLKANGEPIRVCKTATYSYTAP